MQSQYIPGTIEGSLNTVPGDLMVEGHAILNQIATNIGHSDTTRKIITFHRKVILESIVVEVLDNFDGRQEVGTPEHPGLYIPDPSFPKIKGCQVLHFNELVAPKTVIQLTVEGCSTGAAKMWIFWKPLF